MRFVGVYLWQLAILDSAEGLSDQLDERRASCVLTVGLECIQHHKMMSSDSKSTDVSCSVSVDLSVFSY